MVNRLRTQQDVQQCNDMNERNNEGTNERLWKQSHVQFREQFHEQFRSSGVLEFINEEIK